MQTLFQEIEELLKENSHEFSEIKCIRIGRGLASVPLSNFEEWAKKKNIDSSHWTTGIPYPFQLISGKNWWIQAYEYDTRVTLSFEELPEISDPTHCIMGTDTNDILENPLLFKLSDAAKFLNPNTIPANEELN